MSTSLLIKPILGSPASQGSSVWICWAGIPIRDGYFTGGRKANLRHGERGHERSHISLSSFKLMNYGTGGKEATTFYNIVYLTISLKC